jgi:acetyl-CoA carboxylase biotin carboxyl carrier protein
MRKSRGPRAAPTTPRASERAPTYDDILAIARLVESGSRFTEFRLRSGDIEVEVKRANGAVVEQLGPGPLPVPGARGDEPVAPAPDNDARGQAPAGVQLPDLPAGAHVVRSPMVGTFYRAPEPRAKPFVEVGARVKADSIVCIIEVMKLMNSIPAGIAGVVTHVLVENGAMVEPGQPLVAVRPK